MFHRTSITCHYIQNYSHQCHRIPHNPHEIPIKSEIIPIYPIMFQLSHDYLIDWHAILSHRLLQNIYIHYCMTSTPLSILHLSHYYISPSHRLSYQTTSHRLSYYSHAAGRRESLWNPITSTVYMRIYIYICTHIYIYIILYIYVYISSSKSHLSSRHVKTDAWLPSLGQARAS